ncbi:MAG: NUDIX hydrolase [Candidatus Omnitrophica bacterium CG07_land_8_20_14_0_80_42_15]|uniref:GDP-mannose pyrophosphatase n=1 Tax=Candidatus Aquitaenariimonas noxiae TaxID=1974741 RepID=A0A2J0KTP9_9BACT|nr:MAG: NUDIX hydrolase [Candidatus Omnitrophica bacterium CG07_land_8_20_14_0_80_42_15]
MVNGKQIFQGRLLNLFLKRQKFPNGYIGTLEIIKHPGAVLIVPFLSDDKIILIKQYRPVINAYIWELPAGTLNKGEDPLKCARRELIEEIGYDAGILEKIGYIYSAPGYTTEKIIIYKAKKLIKVKAKKEVDEVITPKVFTRKAIQKLINSGKIVDAKTICAIKLVIK